MSTITTAKYRRKPFEVEAVQVTEENINLVADWCSGEVRTTAAGARFIKVRVNHPTVRRQTHAFVGDWVLFAGAGYKVYPNRAFESSFELPA